MVPGVAPDHVRSLDAFPDGPRALAQLKKYDVDELATVHLPLPTTFGYSDDSSKSKYSDVLGIENPSKQVSKHWFNFTIVFPRKRVLDEDTVISFHVKISDVDPADVILPCFPNF